MPSDQATDVDVRVEVYRLFVELGHAPVPAEVAESLDVTQHAVEQSFKRLADDHVLVLAPGTPYIWMANPFSALPTPYVAEAGGRSWFGNCIWDALGIVAMLGGDGKVLARCPDCGESLVTEVAENTLVSGSGVVHFAIPARQWWDDIGFN